MKNFEVKNSVNADLDFVYWLFDQAILYQEKNNYPVWKGYDRKVLQRDIRDQRHYKIMSELEIACIFSLQYADDQLWTDAEKDKAIYLHRVVVNPNFKGNKLFEKIVEWSIPHAKKMNRSLLRMD